MKQEFIKKWSSWWMLRNNGVELTEAFEKELNIIIEKSLEKVKHELEITEKLLNERQQVINAIPECELHGGNCVPHALEWIEKQKTIKTALEILNQVEPNGELLDTDKAIEAMEKYADQFRQSLISGSFGKFMKAVDEFRNKFTQEELDEMFKDLPNGC